MILQYLKQIPDQRTTDGRMYDLAHILLFSILAIGSNANSYRKMAIFIEENFTRLKEVYHLKWRRSPNYNTLRHIIHSVKQEDIEKAFRMYSKEYSKFNTKKQEIISLDGKALRHSFDNVADEKMKQVLSAFSSNNNLILAHESIGTEKDNEINLVIKLIKDLDLNNVIYTMDALHTQKKP